jgi:hypothetical protein
MDQVGRHRKGSTASRTVGGATRFGPDESFALDPISLEDLWNLHDSRTLQLKAAYPIVAAE